MTRPTQRRWPSRLLVGVVVLFSLAGITYGWAWLSLDRSAIARAMLWMDADVGDQFRFPARLIPAGADPSPLASGPEIDLGGLPGAAGETFDDYLRETGTRAFLVVHADRLVYERYFGGTDRGTLETSFSVAKSFLSTLVGIAINEGRIDNVTDSITDYLPELKARDPRFEQITLRDLLTMSSGLRYEEQDLPLPWGDDVDTYYGTDLRAVALEHTEIIQPPRRTWLYNNYNPLLLGLALERAVGMSVSRYMATRLWQPLGAEQDAKWSLDSDSSGFEKMESGLNATAVDYARFGLLMLHHGTWNGNRIVSEGWVREATAVDTATDPAESYQYFWWIDVDRPGGFYALGNYGQYIYVAPDTDTVIVRLGRDWGVDNQRWLALFRGIADRARPEQSGCELGSSAHVAPGPSPSHVGVYRQAGQRDLLGCVPGAFQDRSPRSPAGAARKLRDPRGRRATPETDASARCADELDGGAEKETDCELGRSNEDN